MKIVAAAFLVAVVLAAGCVTFDGGDGVSCTSPEKAVDGTCCFDNDDSGVCDVNERKCPDSCDDSDKCTSDGCSLQTNFECRHDAVTPCCGNNICEPSEDAANECPDDCVVIKMTSFMHSYTGPDYMENDTYVFIHTGSNETDKKPDFYLNITADKARLRNIRATYNCTDSATGHKIDSITVDRVPVVEDYPAEFGYENKFDSADYAIYTSFYAKELKSAIEVGELSVGKAAEFRVRFYNKNYKVRSRLTCDFDFYTLEPLKHVRKQLKISYI